MVRLHPSEFLGGDGCKTIGQEFDGEFDLFEQGVQLAEKIKRCNKWIVGWNFFEQLILEYLSNSINIFCKENEISLSYDPNYQKEIRWNPSLKDFSNASIKIFLL